MLSKRGFLALTLAAGLASCAPKAAPSNIGGPFKLTDQDGRAVDETLLKGKWTAVYFGFTYCPDACPTMLQALGEAIGKIGGKAKKLQVVLISVDPERDTPQLLKTYLDNPAFPKGAIGLTGTPAQIAEAARVYKAYYKKVGTGEDYTFDHVAMVYLMNPKGQFVRPIGAGTPPDEIAHILTSAMRDGD